MDENDRKDTIIAEDRQGRIYVQSIGIYEGFKTMRYEIWSSKEMYEKQIYGNGKHIYCQGICGAKSPEEFLEEYYRE